jgi:hypothetical protein
MAACPVHASPPRRCWLPVTLCLACCSPPALELARLRSAVRRAAARGPAPRRPERPPPAPSVPGLSRHAPPQARGVVDSVDERHVGDGVPRVRRQRRRHVRARPAQAAARGEMAKERASGPAGIATSAPAPLPPGRRARAILVERPGASPCPLARCLHSRAPRQQAGRGGRGVLRSPQQAEPPRLQPRVPASQPRPRTCPRRARPAP